MSTRAAAREGKDVEAKMLEIRERAANGHASTLRLVLPFEERQRSRRRVRLSTGEEVLLALARGTVLRGGDLVKLSDGRVVVVEAAAETVSTVRARDARSLARAAYHLGNRHVALEVGEGFVRYLHDHVLDAMVSELGLAVVVEEAPFEPEGGAYARHGRDRAQAYEGSHEDGHGHGHGHGDEDAHEGDRGRGRG